MISRKAFLYRTAASLAVIAIGFIIIDFPLIKWYAQELLHVHSSGPAITQSTTKLQTPNFLTIPSLNISAPIQYITEKNEKAYQNALINGVVHYPGTALPGEKGNVYIFGHSSDYVFSKGHFKTIFASLPNIKIGELIIVTNAQGETFTYTADKKYITSGKDISVLKQPDDDYIITLQTSYPVGTALKRYVVVGKLQNSP